MRKTTKDFVPIRYVTESHPVALVEPACIEAGMQEASEHFG
jgi:hypothetical protein